jgi:hypothetical protein
MYSVRMTTSGLQENQPCHWKEAVGIAWTRLSTLPTVGKGVCVGRIQGRITAHQVWSCDDGCPQSPRSLWGYKGIELSSSEMEASSDRRPFPLGPLPKMGDGSHIASGKCCSEGRHDNAEHQVPRVSCHTVTDDGRRVIRCRVGRTFTSATLRSAAAGRALPVHES